MRPARVLLLSLVALCAIALHAAPTAILVDTSRSIPPQQFADTKGVLAGLLPDLLAKGPVAVYAFNDEPVKVVDFTSDLAALQAGVEKLQPGGRFTLLYDCVFSAVKDIAARKEAGIVLLVTDGKDENSAVTLEDSMTRATEAHVAVVTVGVGTAEENVLRRMAVLSGGRYAGRVPQADAAAIRGAWSESLAGLQPVVQPVAPKPVETAPAPAPQPPTEPPFLQKWWWLMILLGLAGLGILVAVGAGIAVLLKRTKSPEERTCEKCGQSLNVWESECPSCLAQKLAITKPGESTQSEAAPAVPELDPALLQKGPPSESLDHTLVLDEVPVLILQRGKNPPRMFQLPQDQVVSVGRDKVNTLSVADQTLSGQHFRIVPKNSTYYLADLQSTNGTFLDGERVTLKELRPGSVIHAGQCDFVFKREQKKLN